MATKSKKDVYHAMLRAKGNAHSAHNSYIDGNLTLRAHSKVLRAFETARDAYASSIIKPATSEPWGDTIDEQLAAQNLRRATGDELGYNATVWDQGGVGFVWATDI